MGPGEKAFLRSLAPLKGGVDVRETCGPRVDGNGAPRGSCAKGLPRAGEGLLVEVRNGREKLGISGLNIGVELPLDSRAKGLPMACEDPLTGDGVAWGISAVRRVDGVDGFISTSRGGPGFRL